MKRNLLLLAATLSLLVSLGTVVLFMEHYDVKPQSWGPKGVEFEEWHKVWSARRDLYVWVGICSFFTAVALAAGGLLLIGKRNRRLP